MAPSFAVNDYRKKWFQSALVTLGILVSAIAEKLLEGSLNNEALLDAIIGVPSVIVIATILVLSKYRKPWARKLADLAVKGLGWGLTLFAGLLFGVAYVLFAVLWQAGLLSLGIVVVALFFGAVMTTMHFLKLEEDSTLSPKSTL